MENNEIEFLKDFYNSLKTKNSNNLSSRFQTQLKQLFDTKEISLSTFHLMRACVTVAEHIDNIEEENLDIIRDLINIGIELRDEKDSQKVMKKLSRSKSTFKNNDNW